MLSRTIKRIETKKHAEAHQRKGRREPHQNDDDDERQHQEAERRIADHVCRSPPMPRWRAVSSICCARSMAIWRDSSSTYSLAASCSPTTSISATSLRRLGNSPVLRQATQRTISASPWSMTRAPAIGITVLKWYTGGPSAVTFECSAMRQDSAA